MEVLTMVGKILFIVIWVLGMVLNFFQPKWYWKGIIPKIHKKEEEHPIIAGSIFLLLATVMLIGVLSAII